MPASRRDKCRRAFLRSFTGHKRRVTHHYPSLNRCQRYCWDSNLSRDRGILSLLPDIYLLPCLEIVNSDYLPRRKRWGSYGITAGLRRDIAELVYQWVTRCTIINSAAVTLCDFNRRFGKKRAVTIVFTRDRFQKLICLDLSKFCLE